MTARTVGAGAGRTTFATLCGVGVLARLSYAMARTPVLALFALHLGAPPDAIGFVVGISTVTGILFKLPAGVASDIVGRRSMLLAGLCVFALVPFGYVLVADYWSLVALRFLHGFATAIYGPVAMATIADIAGARKAELLSWFSSLSIVGTLCGAPLGGFLLWWLSPDAPTGLSTFHIVYTVIGGIGTAALALAIWRVGRLAPGQLSPTERRSLAAVLGRFGEGVREMVSDYRVVVTSAMEGLQNMLLGALEAFLPIYAVTVAGLNAFQAGALWGVQILVTLATKPLLGRIADSHGRKPIIIAGMGLCAASFVLIPTQTAFVALAIAGMVFGLGEAMVTSSSAAMVADMCAEKHYGAAMGAFGTFYDVGHAAGPIVAGLLVAAFAGNYLAAFLPLAVVMAAGTALFAFTVSERTTNHDTARK